MKRGYQKFLSDDFARDLRFVNWVKRGIEDEFWKNFILDNPHLLNEIEKAIKIVKMLNFNTISSDKYAMDTYPEVERRYTLIENPKSVSFMYRYLKYAAIFVLLFALSITYIALDSKNSQLSDNNVDTNQSKGIHMLLPDGQSMVFANNTIQLKFDEQDELIRLTSNNEADNRELSVSKRGQVKLSTPYGVRLDVVLSDGSKVCLGSGSTLNFPRKFEGKNRKVSLDGEAFFEIAKNEKNPFIVSSNEIDIKVLGTEFNVNSRSKLNVLEVVLVEGSVSLRNTSESRKDIKLFPSQKATYDKRDKKFAIQSNVDVNFYISWKDGFLEFKRIDINSVFDKLSDYYNVRFITDSNIEANRNITGKLELKESFHDVMNVLSDAALFDFEIHGNQVIVKNKSGSLPILTRH